MGQKVLGFENKIKFHHILARIFFSPIHISKLLYWLVILGKTSKRLNTQSVGPSEPRGQEAGGGGGNCPLQILAGIEAKPSLSTCLGLLFIPPSRFSDLPTALHSVSWGILCGPSQTAGPGKAGWCGS